VEDSAVTTIAYRDGVLAGDSCHSWCDAETDNYWIYKYENKLEQSGPVMFGTSGDVDSPDFLKMLRGLKKPSDLPPWSERKKFEGSKALIVFCKPELAVFAMEDGELDSCGEYHAIGSGARFAVAAMDMGASAHEAVVRACYRDCFSREPVHALYADPSKAPPKE
jgi:hypothetical protein